MLKTQNIPIGIGFIVWILLIFNWLPISTFSLTYVQILILVAPLWLIPMAWRLLDIEDWTKFLGVPASITFALAFFIAPSLWASILATPWLPLDVCGS